MLKELLITIGWIDILMGCIVLRCFYIGFTKGFVVEFFKFLGMVFASFITLHYYFKIAQLLQPLISIPFVYCELVAFILIWLVCVFVFKIIRDGLMVFIKMEAHPIVHKAGGGVISLARASLICSLTFSLLFVSGNRFLIRSSRSSFSGFYLIELCPKIYWSGYDNFVGKIFPKDKKNKEVFFFRYKTEK